MTILYCLSHINKSLQWQWFAEEMQNRGVKQIYLIVDKPGTKKNHFYDDLQQMGVESYVIFKDSSLSHIRNIGKAISLIRRNKINIVHTSLPFGNLTGLPAALVSGVSARITTCENASWAHDFGHRKQERVDKLTYKIAKKVIAVADSANEYLKEHYHLTDKKMLSIYHGLKESEYENISAERVNRLKEQFNIHPEDFVVGVVARYEFWKGHEFINKAAAILKQRGLSGIKILVWGSKGSYYETAMQQIKELGVEDIVMYKGYCDDPVALFRVFDVHLHVPINKYVENCGINIIEGMISACPQILTKSGYAWQSAVHLQNAWVVDYENAEAIADAIVSLKENPELAKKIGEQAKKDALATYGLKIKADKHIELYNSLL